MKPETFKELIPIFQWLGVHKIIFNYCGYGDSGEIESIDCYGFSGSEDIIPSNEYPPTFTRLLKELADAALPEGYEINEGSEGYVVVECNTGGYEVVETGVPGDGDEEEIQSDEEDWYVDGSRPSSDDPDEEEEPDEIEEPDEGIVDTSDGEPDNSSTRSSS